MDQSVSVEGNLCSFQFETMQFTESDTALQGLDQALLLMNTFQQNGKWYWTQPGCQSACKQATNCGMVISPRPQLLASSRGRWEKSQTQVVANLFHLQPLLPSQYRPKKSRKPRGSSKLPGKIPTSRGALSWSWKMHRSVLLDQHKRTQSYNQK